MRTLIIGRSRYADVVIADPSVAPYHAELVITADGRHHLTDRATTGGSWSRGGDGAWAPLRQAFVAADEPLRLGEHECTAAGLAAAARPDRDDAARGPAPGVGGGERPRPRGRVERDPVTGEIVRRL